jgi:RimJ/RimL family protein N-acetyltransferase
MEAVRQILTLPSIFRHIGDDSTAPRLEFQPVDHPAIWYVMAYDGEEELGVFLLCPENFICWQVHVAMLPSAMIIKGRFTECGRQFIEWVWQNTPCLRLVAHVPAFNRLALRFAERAGLQQYGVNKMSFAKKRTLHDQIDLGISKPEVT